MKEFGKYTVWDHGDKFMVVAAHSALCIYKGMLNSRAQSIISCATREEDIKAFLMEYSDILGRVSEAVEILINKR